MADRQFYQYQKKPQHLITAVQLDLDTDGFTFIKWGDEQRCRAGDWLVNSDDDCYTVADESFRKTYRQVSPGRYYKHAIIWARQATSSGCIDTSEGQTHYKAGDYIVANADDGSDNYAIDHDTFHTLYERVGPQ